MILGAAVRGSWQPQSAGDGGLVLIPGPEVHWRDALGLVTDPLSIAVVIYLDEDEDGRTGLVQAKLVRDLKGVVQASEVLVAAPARPYLQRGQCPMVCANVTFDSTGLPLGGYVAGLVLAEDASAAPLMVPFLLADHAAFLAGLR